MWRYGRKIHVPLICPLCHHVNILYVILLRGFGGRWQIIIDRNKMPSPSFMAVITAVGQYAYQRKDGVLVLPIGCLKD